MRTRDVSTHVHRVLLFEGHNYDNGWIVCLLCRHADSGSQTDGGSRATVDCLFRLISLPESPPRNLRTYLNYDIRLLILNLRIKYIGFALRKVLSIEAVWCL